jgi:hypothetical protein
LKKHTNMITQFQNILLDTLLFSEIVATLVGVLYYSKLKNTYWKWFVLYLVFITIESIIIEFFGLKDIRMYIYDFLIVPIEFFFFFWLYANQSLKRKNLFWIFCIIYILSYLPHLFYSAAYKTINATSYIVGCLLLFVLVVLEFFKQIVSDDILLFKQNKMFYINTGIILFYIGSLPFHAFIDYLYKNENTIFGLYYTYFLFSNNLMYLLFAASFIWGKPNK